MITTLILTKNNEKTISHTLESIKDISEIIVADLGSKDSTKQICEKLGCKVYNTNFNHNYSAIRNNLALKAHTDWLFWLDPGEVVSSGHDLFKAELTDQMYRVMVLKDDLLMKQPRLFRKGVKFSKPVFEEIEDKAEQTLPIIITGNAELDVKSIMDSILKWKDDEPLSPEPDYYLANLHLFNKKYDQFLTTAEKFIFQKEKVDASVVLTKYYMASLLKKRDTGKALKLILECISEYPLMAEFWCLLGDLYLFYIKEYDRAYQYYENAMILGSQRLAEDTMPMEISKYEEYPQKMMDLIRQAISKTLSGKYSSYEETHK